MMAGGGGQVCSFLSLFQSFSKEEDVEGEGGGRGRG